MKVVITDYYYPNIDQEIEILSQIEEIEIFDCKKMVPNWSASEQQLLEVVKDADALIVQFAKITKNVIASMKKCKIIARYAIGVDTIDVVEAHKSGIVVANVPDYCIEEVSDTALAHILNCVRKISFSRDLMLHDGFSFELIAPMQKISDLNVGLLGFGNIARCLAKKIQPLCQKVLAYDPYFKDKDKYTKIEFVTFAELLSGSDIVSIHVPLNENTRHMLSMDQFMAMKDRASIVNTARGEIINENDLLKALDSGKISYCGLDVLQTEKFNGNPLSHHPHVAVTPHLGWNSISSIRDLQKKTALNVYKMLTTGEPLYKI
jgi:D-3-phosphoglycerate dehydrogenase